MVTGRDRLATRVVYAWLAAIWLAAAVLPIAGAGALHGFRSVLWLLAVLASGASTPWRGVRVSVSLLAPCAYVAWYWQDTHVGFVPSTVHLAIVIAREFSEVFHHGTLADPLQTWLFVWLLTGAYWLVSYASRRTVLWLFYNAIACAGLIALSSMAPVKSLQAAVALLAVMFFALAVHRGGYRWETRALARVAATVTSILAVAGGLVAVFPHRTFAGAHEGRGGQSTGTSGLVTGYTLNDAQLGGSLSQNSRPVLTLTAPEPTYLRGQTLATYTGQGWISAPLTDSQMQSEQLDQLIADNGFTGLPARSFDETITLLSPVDTSDLLAGYEVTDVIRLPGLYDGRFALDTVQGNIQAPRLRPGQSYEVETTVPTNPYPLLAGIREPFAAMKRAIPLDVQEYDLQLPSTLPKSVAALAQRTVQRAHATTEYEMVKSLMSYLQTHEMYTTTNVPTPTDGQDYVAQFLFQSHRGYCDNFSSALAVMLRTLGVPTRWVTGFAVSHANQTGPDTYVVTDADAHAWVEVYFPEYGWIPFDPTPTFHMPFGAGFTLQGGSPGDGSGQPSSTGEGHPFTPTHTQQTWDTLSKTGEITRFRWTAWAVLAFGVIFGLSLCAIVVGYIVHARRLERLWRTAPELALANTCRELLQRSLPSAGKSATLRQLWPLARASGTSQEDFFAWLSEAEAVLYGGVPLETGAALRLREPLDRWRRMIGKSTTFVDYVTKAVVLGIDQVRTQRTIKGE